MYIQINIYIYIYHMYMVAPVWQSSEESCWPRYSQKPSSPQHLHPIPIHWYLLPATVHQDRCTKIHQRWSHDASRDVCEHQSNPKPTVGEAVLKELVTRLKRTANVLPLKIGWNALKGKEFIFHPLEFSRGKLAVSFKEGISNRDAKTFPVA